jgi:hypothetical protein
MLTEKQQSEILDSLWVVAENQLGGWCACDSIGGDLITYATYEEAQKAAEAVIEDLNEWSVEIELEGEVNYDEDSWGAKRLSEVTIGDNQERIVTPKQSTLNEGYRSPKHPRRPPRGITTNQWKALFPIQRIDG